MFPPPSLKREEKTLPSKLVVDKEGYHHQETVLISGVSQRPTLNGTPANLEGAQQAKQTATDHMLENWKWQTQVGGWAPLCWPWGLLQTANRAGCQLP